MILKSLFFFVLTCFSLSANALGVVFGLGASEEAIWVDDNSLGYDEVAKLESDTMILPSIGIRTESRYFNEDSGWGFHFEVNGSLIDIKTQTIPDSEPPVDVGTGIRGYSIYVVPLAYYHFKRNSIAEWSYKAGIGLGAGYLNLKGNFKITGSSSPNYNDIEDVNASGVGMAGGAYFEASKGSHLIVIQNFVPMISDKRYSYSQLNLLFSYKYVVELFK